MDIPDDKKQLFKEVRDLAVKYALSRSRSKKFSFGGAVDPDDFAQEVILYMLRTGKDDPGVLMHRYADFMRKKFGDIRNTEGWESTPYQLKKQANNLNFNELDDKELEPFNSKLEILVDRIYLDKYFRSVPMAQRILYILLHKYEYEYKELALMSGLSDTRVCQLLKETQRKITFNLRDFKIAAPPKKRRSKIY